MRAYKTTSSEQEIQVSEIEYGLNFTKPKKIKEQGCVEIEKDGN